MSSRLFFTAISPGAMSCLIGVIGAALMIGACAEPQPASPTVSQALSRPASAALSPTPRPTTAAPTVRADSPSGPTESPSAQAGSSDSAGNAPVAFVDGVPISRRRIVDLLLAGHGPGMLEQLVVLEKARAMAAEQGLSVTQNDINAEFDRSLRNMLSPFRAADEGGDFDREEAERVLNEVLARRNVSRDECMMVVKRNAYLRAICNANMTFTDEQLAEEYQRSFGPRVQVRHIQAPNLADAERALGLLDSGVPFADVARDYSANLRTAPAGGLLRPFSANDPDVPPAMAATAFGLAVGDVSKPFRVEDWYHIVKLEEKLPADPRPISEVRPELEAGLRDRLTDAAMQTLYRSLFEQADIRIEDPVLAEEFARKHPERVVRTPAP